MDRTQKEELVASFNDAFSEATLVVVTSQSGLTVAQSTELRQEMRQAGASLSPHLGAENARTSIHNYPERQEAHDATQ